MKRGIVVLPPPMLDPSALEAELEQMRRDPELAACILLIARPLAWTTHGNTVGLAYAERRDLFAKLRGAVAAYDGGRA